MDRPAILDEIHIAELDIDEYINRPVYFFTWNPNDKKICADDYNNKWMTMITKCLKYFNSCMLYYCVVPEVSDAGRLHCHGWFIIKDKIKWVKRVKPLLEQNGRFKMSKQKVKGEGFYYYKKDIEETSGIVRRDLWPLTIYTIEDIMLEIRFDKSVSLAIDTCKSMDITQFFLEV